MQPRGTTLEVGHLLAGSSVNYVGVGLEQFDPQQPVMVGRLILGRNAEPFVIRVEGGHWFYLSKNFSSRGESASDLTEISNTVGAIS